MDTQVGEFDLQYQYKYTFNLYLIKSSLQGNGLQCFDANGTMAVSGDAHVELEMTLTSQVGIMLA